MTLGKMRAVECVGGPLDGSIAPRLTDEVLYEGDALFECFDICEHRIERRHVRYVYLLESTPRGVRYVFRHLDDQKGPNR